MQKRKVWKLVQLLEPKERRRFELWLKGELGKNQKTTVLLYQLLCEDRPIEYIWEQLYPGKAIPDRPFYDSGYRRLEHSLSSLLETYFAFQAFSKDLPLKDIYLLRELKARKSQDLFVGKLKKSKQKSQEESVRDEQYHRHLYLLERESLDYQISFKGKDILKHSRRTNQQYEIWWVHEKMRMALMTLSLKRFYKDQDFSSLLVPNILDEIANNNALKNHPVLIIYYRLYLLLEGKDQPGSVIDFVKNHIISLSPDAKKDVFLLLINHYNGKVNATGELEDKEKLLVLYEWGVEAGFLLNNNIMPWQLLKNMIRLCIKLTKISEAKSYLERFKHLLSEQEREEAFLFNQAMIFMAEGDFKNSMPIFSRKFSNIHYEIAARTSLIKIRYLQEEREELANDIRALKYYCDRKASISDIQKQGLINELRLIDKLIRTFDQKGYQALLEEVQTTKPLSNPDWILEQLNKQLDSEIVLT